MKHLKRYLLFCFALGVVLAVCGLGGCFSMLAGLSGINNGGPSTGDKVAGAALDVVTMPVQLPFWILVGIGAGLEKLDRSVEDSAWQSKRQSIHSLFAKDPAAIHSTAPEFTPKGPAMGLVYQDEAIPLSEEFLVASVMRYYSYVRRMSPIPGDDEMAALMLRKEWTPDGLRAVASQIYLGRRHYPAPDYVALAYLSNPKTPPDVIDAFMKHPSFKYRTVEHYAKTMRDEIATNIVAKMERPTRPAEDGTEEEPDTPESQFHRFLGNNLGAFHEGKAAWRVGGGMWDLCAVGVPSKPWNLLIGDTPARVVELYGDRPNREWTGADEYNGAIGAVVLEFDSVSIRDAFLKSVLPACRYCGPECWEQLAFAPMDGGGEIYGICLEREKKPEGAPSRIFIIRLDCPSAIRFWPPREYGSSHVWFADGTNP